MNIILAKEIKTFTTLIIELAASRKDFLRTSHEGRSYCLNLFVREKLVRKELNENGIRLSNVPICLYVLCQLEISPKILSKGQCEVYVGPLMHKFEHKMTTSWFQIIFRHRAVINKKFIK